MAQAQHGASEQCPGAEQRKRVCVVGDAPARRHSAAQRDERAIKTTPMGPRLPTLAVAEARSHPPNRGLPGMTPEQPDAPKETTSAAGPSTPARCRSCPRTSPPPPHAPQMQGSGATSASSTAFPTSPTLSRHQHAQPRRFLQNPRARACMGVTGRMGDLR
eukprot:COSAG02_NODE_5373_length_4390_cov_3.127709_3_plen_161_part_00